LKRILTFKAKNVLTTDPYVTTDATLVPLEQVLAEADLLIVATPHKEYRDLNPQQPVADVWDLYGNGVRI
jgi:UDP-N-acetyl-D-mannosaminuronic acid dehydrogenase